jgi:hypothetical protein
MCVLTIKKDENLLPLHAESNIVVLDNHKDRVWSKSDRYAPVLCCDSLRFLVSLAVEKRRPLRQGDCKNVFCQGILSPDEITIVCPPSGDPDANPNEYWLLLWTLYGLRAVLVIGMTKSMQSFAPSAYPLPLKILVSSLGLSKIQRPHLVPICLVHSPLVSTLTISSIYPKTLLSKSFSVVFWPNITKSTLWALLNGYSEFISLGVLLPLWLQSTSISQVLPPI